MGGSVKQVRQKAAAKRASNKHHLPPVMAEVQSLIDQLSKNENPARLAELCASIQADGQRLPIVMRGKQIIDGRMRWLACQQLKIKPKVIDVAELGGSQDPQRVWMQLNDVRRHLNAGERALLAYQLSASRKAGDNQHSASLSQKEAAKRMGVSVDAVQRVPILLRKAKDAGIAERVMRSRIANGEPISRLIREAQQVGVAQDVAKLKKNDPGAMKSLESMAAHGIQFSVLYADPPWNYGRPEEEAVKGSSDPRLHYPVLSTSAIAGLPVKPLAAPDSVLWLWVPNCLLRDGLRVLEAWGFDYVTSMVWSKNRSQPSKGAILPAHETCLVGKRGNGLVFQGNPARQPS